MVIKARMVEALDFSGAGRSDSDRCHLPETVSKKKVRENNMKIYDENGKQLFKKQPTLYGCEAVQNLIDRYYEAGGEALEIEPGSLGYGLTVCYGDGLKTAVITEVYINEWSSGHKVRFYNEMPAKYEKMINDYFEKLEESEA